MRTHGLIGLVLVLLVAGSARADGESDPWASFTLKEQQTTHAYRLRVDTKFADRADELAKVIDKRLAELDAARNRVDTFAAQRDAVIGHINQLFRIQPDNDFTQKQRKAFEGVVGRVNRGLPPVEGLDILILDAERAKKLLSDGVKLPQMSYDAEERAASLSLQFKTQHDPDDAPIPEQAGPVINVLPLPVKDDEDPVEMIDQVLGRLSAYASEANASGTINVTAQATLLNYLPPTDEYGRWFIEAFAGVLTYETLGRLKMHDQQREYDKNFSNPKYDALRKQSEMRYWMIRKHEIKLASGLDDPIESARYAVAYQLGKGLVDKHGAEFLPALVADLHARPKRQLGDWADAVTKATGEDFKPHLDACQSDPDVAKLRTQRYGAFAEAQKGGDHHKTLLALKRYVEVRFSDPQQRELRMYVTAAHLHLKLGKGRHGAQLIMQSAARFKPGSPPRVLLLGALSEYALQADHPEYAFGTIEEVLKAARQHVPSLLVLAERMVAAGQWDRAAQVSRRIRDELAAQLKPHHLRSIERVLNPGGV